MERLKRRCNARNFLRAEDLAGGSTRGGHELPGHRTLVSSAHFVESPVSLVNVEVPAIAHRATAHINTVVTDTLRGHAKRFTRLIDLPRSTVPWRRAADASWQKVIGVNVCRLRPGKDPLTLTRLAVAKAAKLYLYTLTIDLSKLGVLPTMSSKFVWIVALATALPVASQAAAYKCTDAKGRVSFSDIPCPTSATTAEKVMGRGAGYNPLSSEEKSDFKKGVMMSCTAPRNVCECFGETMADTLTYEELQETIKNGNKPMPSLAEKSKQAMRSCQAMETRR